jgi:multidrug resistance protein, MATE family
VVTRDRLRTITSLSLPIIGGMVSQNVMNLVDTAMVGSLGKEALAAVGIAGFATFLSQAFLTGISSGVQAIAARRMGEGRTGVAAVPLNGGLLLSLLVGVPVSALLYLLAPRLFPYLNDDPAVVAIGVPYFQVRLIAVTAVAMNFSFRGYFNGVNLSKLYMRTLVVMHVSNIAISYVLIFGALGFPELGAKGAAVGTTLATYLGTLTYFSLGLAHARKSGFLHGLPDRETFVTMLRLSVPTGVQQMFFAGGLTALFWIVGQVGTSELAAANVLVNIMLVGILPGLALGLAAASLVGQALGRGDEHDARRWGMDVARCASVALAVLGAPMLFVPELLLGAFIRNDPVTLALGVLPLRLVGATLWWDAIGSVLMNALLGAGDSRRVAAVAIGTQWLLFLPVAFLVGPVLGGGLTAIWAAQAGYRSLQTVVYIKMWRGAAWASIRV